MTEGDNDSFTVSASNLVSTHSYTIRVETNNSDVGFNSSCSDRQEEVTVPSGRTSYSTTFTLYGCDTSGGTVTATLRRGTTSVDTDSQYVGVTAPSIEIRNLATTLQEGQSDSFLVWASNLNTSHLYTFQVETDNSDIGFNATCSIRSRTQSVPSSSTSESAGFTLHACDASGGRATATLLRGGTTVDTDYQDVIVPSPAVFQFTPSPLALGGTSNVWTIPTGVTSVYVDVDFSEGIYKDEDAGDINVNRVNSFGTVLSTLAVDNEDDSRTWTGAADGSLIRIDVDNDAFDVSLALVTLTFHSGSDTTGPEIARATVQKESRPYAPTNGSGSVDATNGSVTLSWGPGAARLGSNPDHYEVVIPDTSNPSTPLYSNLNVDDSTTPTTLTISNARALGLEGSHTAEVRHCNAAGGCSLPLNITFTLPAPPTATVFQFTPSPLALGGTSNVWTIPTGVTSVYVDVDFSEGIYKDEDAGDINVNRVNSFGTVLSTLAVDNENDSRTWTGAVDGSLIRIDVDNDAFDVSLALVTLTFHSGSDTTGPEIARATVQKESRPYAPTNGSASVDETNGSVTLSWGPGAARLGSNPDHYEVVIPDATNPSTPLYSNLNVDDSTTPTTLTISNARALGLEGSHTAEVRHCNAAGGCSLPLNITFMVTPSIALLGVGASLEVDASDQFSVSVRRLNPSHNYLIRVVYTTSHIAEDSGCLGGSTNTIRNFSGSTTFYLSTFNVYGCSAGTSTITANLHRVISGVEQVSSLATAVAPVSVITPNPPAAPTDLTGGVGDRGISLSWPAPSGTVTGYKVQRRVDTIGTSFSTITTLNGKDSTTHTDGDAALVEGTSYLYRVIAFNSGGDSQPSDDVTVSFKIITSEWNVLDYRYVLIDWLLPSNQRTTGHQFRFGILRTGGADAGFQIYPATATNARKCNWSSPPSDYTSWSNLGTAFYVVRCKLGTGNGHIELQRIPDSGSSRPITSILTIGPVKQSWHRADHQVGYLVDSPFMDGAKPGHLPAAYTVNEATSTTAMSDAASAWNAGQTYVTFEVVTTTPDTTIRGYWNPYGTSLNDKCKGSIACVYGGGEYPELEHQQFWIEFPPRFPGDGDYKEWTNDIAEVRQMPDDFYYLPQVIMHEFGHTAGLGHTLVGDVMGPIYSRDPLSGPTSYDLNGITNIYQNHTRHQEGTQ